MTNLITKAYFKADIQLPTGAYDNLDLFITKFQKECLMYLLGYELYALLEEAMTVVAPATVLEPYKSLIDGAEYLVGDRKVKWNGLKNSDEVSLLANYVYCEYLRNRVTETTPSGETVSNNENSNQASVFAKIFNAWNKFEELYGYNGQDEMIPSAYNYLMVHQTDFPKWYFTSLYGSINSHGL